MGTYATTTSLATRMVGTTFDSLTTSLASEMISDAEAEINKYISKRYDITSFTTTAIPPIINAWAKRLAEGYMHQSMARGGKEAMDRGQKLIDQVITNLEKVASYHLDIIDSTGTPLEELTDGGFRVLSNTSDYTPTFAEDSSVNWKVDQDKLDDIESDRD